MSILLSRDKSGAPAEAVGRGAPAAWGVVHDHEDRAARVRQGQAPGQGIRRRSVGQRGPAHPHLRRRSASVPRTTPAELGLRFRRKIGDACCSCGLNKNWHENMGLQPQDTKHWPWPLTPTARHSGRAGAPWVGAPACRCRSQRVSGLGQGAAGRQRGDEPPCAARDLSVTVSVSVRAHNRRTNRRPPPPGHGS